MIPIKNEAFQKIVCFYLFECPARAIRVEDKKKDESRTPDQPHPNKRIFYGRTSQMGRTFAERGITGGKLNTLRAALLRSAGNDFELLTGKEGIVSEKKEFISLTQTEFITEGIFSFIRNAFAHGEFSVIDGVYHLENHQRGKLKGKAIVNESTLLAWIDIVNMPLEDMKKIGK